MRNLFIFSHRGAAAIKFGICNNNSLIEVIESPVIERPQAPPIPYPAILGGAGFSMSIATRKTVVQMGSLGCHWKLSPVGARGETLEIFVYFAF